MVIVEGIAICAPGVSTLGSTAFYKLIHQHVLKALVGYRNPRHYSGKPQVAAPNTLNREFNPVMPNQSWVTGITYIRTHEGRLYLAAVMDLFSRHIVGWSMQSRITKELVLDELLMAVWRRKPKQKVLIHSDQGSQYTSEDWILFVKAHNLESSNSRRGNCHDNAVAESFFQLLKRGRIKRIIYNYMDKAKRDIFDYIGFFYNSKRRHNSNNLLSPIDFEKQFNQSAEKCLQN